MGLTYYGEQSVAYPAIFGAGGVPATYYFGLQNVTVYPSGAGFSVPAGSLYIPSSFNTPGLSNRIFIATTGGTTSGTEPAWTNVVAGGFVADGSVQWNDVASTTATCWLSTNPTWNEVSTTNGYARSSVDNNTTNFPAPGGSSPTTGHNGTAINFPSSTGSWGTIGAITIHDSLTSGNVLAFLILTASLTISSSGTTPSIPAISGLTFSLF
jgi:hypothetical protein